MSEFINKELMQDIFAELSEGKKYQNKYCWVCKIIDGKIYKLKEYMDTQLVTETFKN